MQIEGYKGVGRKNRRLMIRLWKESGTHLSLQAWARTQEIGHVARAWIEHKKQGSA